MSSDREKQEHFALGRLYCTYVVVACIVLIYKQRCSHSYSVAMWWLLPTHMHAHTSQYVSARHVHNPALPSSSKGKHDTFIFHALYWLWPLFTGFLLKLAHRITLGVMTDDDDYHRTRSLIPCRFFSRESKAKQRLACTYVRTCIYRQMWSRFQGKRKKRGWCYSKVNVGNTHAHEPTGPCMQDGTIF